MKKFKTLCLSAVTVAATMAMCLGAYAVADEYSDTVAYSASNPRVFVENTDITMDLDLTVNNITDLEYYYLYVYSGTSISPTNEVFYYRGQFDRTTPTEDDLPYSYTYTSHIKNGSNYLTAGSYLYRVYTSDDKTNQTGNIKVISKDECATVNYMSITTDLSIGVKLLFTMPDGYTAHFEYGDTVEDLSAAQCDSQVVSGTVYLAHTVNMAAKEMADDINFYVTDANDNIWPLLDGDDVVDDYTYTYSVDKYVDYVNDNSSSFTSSQISLVNAMSDYGSMAQEYFGYNTENKESIKNASAISAVTASKLSSYEKTVDDSNAPTGLSYKYMSLFGNSKVTPRLYITMPDGASVSDYNVTGSTATKGTYGQYMTLTFADANITSLDTTYTVNISSGSKSLKVSFSPYSYIYSVLSSSTADAKLSNVMKALYLYSQAAKAYN